MCLTVKKDAVSVVANRDIICYKFGGIAGDIFTSPYQSRFSYQKGVITHYVELRVRPYFSHILNVVTRAEVNEGYHTFNKAKDAKTACQVEKFGGSVGIFIIPKGTAYLDGTFDSFTNRTSTNLIFFGKNNWWNRWKLKKKYGKNCLETL